MPAPVISVWSWTNDGVTPPPVILTPGVSLYRRATRVIIFVFLGV